MCCPSEIRLLKYSTSLPSCKLGMLNEVQILNLILIIHIQI